MAACRIQAMWCSYTEQAFHLKHKEETFGLRNNSTVSIWIPQNQHNRQHNNLIYFKENSKSLKLVPHIGNLRTYVAGYFFPKLNMANPPRNLITFKDLLFYGFTGR